LAIICGAAAGVLGAMDVASDEFYFRIGITAARLVEDADPCANVELA
jgi:hypothetical protein